ncbi:MULTISPECIES: hypothetical protein [unclassified Aeromonas]|uniref:hypothetical protein n=1 Tax=unclassified Aeromonas TaxID=257493 RepID=UPI0022E71B56|nr:MULTISPECIES: hypothetical protein [unclassified Aeromonas]
MIESELTKSLTPFAKVYPFKIPDTETGTAISYRRIGNRVRTKYYSMNQQISEALYFVVRQEPTYISLCDDSNFISSITKYKSENLLSIRFDGYEDFETTNGQYERQYRLIVLHKETI